MTCRWNQASIFSARPWRRRRARWCSAWTTGPRKTLALTDLIRLAPIGASVWSRVDGNVDAGFSFAQANLETHWTVNGAATYRSPRYQLGANVASQLTAREDADATSRNSLNLNATRSLANRWYTLGWGQFQQNQELSLELRAVAGGGVGRDLSHTDHRLWSTYVGLAYTHERFSGEPTDQSAEAAVGGQLDFFTPSHEDMQDHQQHRVVFQRQRPPAGPRWSCKAPGVTNS